MKDIIYKDESYKIVGACFEVYKEKGCGFLEALYQECLEIEFEMQGILFVPKKPLALNYKGRPLKQSYEPDFLCLDKIILEIKAVSALADEHRARVLNYLKRDRLQAGHSGQLWALSETGMGTDRQYKSPRNTRNTRKRRTIQPMSFSCLTSFSRHFACFAGNQQK